MTILQRTFKYIKKQYKRLENNILGWDLKRLVRLMTSFAVVVGLIGLYLWYGRMYMTDERRFWLALENSMATQSVTRTLTNGGTGNQAVQDQQFFFAPQMASVSHVTYSQKSSLVDTAVETEGISFPDAQYSRYTAFSTNQKKDDGSIPNLAGIIDKWESTIYPEESKLQARQNYVGELVTLAIFGNYDASFRNDVVAQMKQNKVFDFNDNSFSRTVVDGENILEVNVSINLKPYIVQLQRAFQESGYGEFPALDPSKYAEDSKINALYSVNMRSNAIVGISFGNREEKYSGYGIQKKIEAPLSEFDSGELEKIVKEEIGTAL